MSVARATLSFTQLTAPIRYMGKNNSVWTVYSCPLDEICALKYLGVSSLYIYIGIYYINISVSTCKIERLLFLNHSQRFFFNHWVLSSLEISFKSLEGPRGRKSKWQYKRTRGQRREQRDEETRARKLYLCKTLHGVSPEIILFSDIPPLSVHIKLWKIFLTPLKIIDVNDIFRL